MMMKTERDKITSAVYRGLNWLLDSGIRVAETHHECYGGFKCSYYAKRDLYDCVHTEITAYGIETLLYFYTRKAEPRLLQAAEEAGNYLVRIEKIRTMYGDVYYPFEYKFPKNEYSARTYLFDVGICLEALIDLYKVTRKEKYLYAGLRAANWILEHINPYGSPTCFVDLSSEKKKNYYDLPGPYHAKICIGLLKAYEMSHNEQYFDAHKKLCDWALHLQNQNGSFHVNLSRHEVFVHFHCYATEALLFSSLLLHDDRYLKGAVEGANWLLKVQSRIGGLYAWSNRATFFDMILHRAFIANDATAQAIRLWLFLLEKNYSIYIKAIRRAVRHLLGMQCLEKANTRTFGAFQHMRPRMNKAVPKLGVASDSDQYTTWTTAFSIHALDLFNRTIVDKNGKLSPSWIF